jgi:hypothetical protein
MKVCDRCHRVFDEKDPIPTLNPPQRLGEMFLRSLDRDQSFICEDCKKELGILNLMGFKM